MEQPLPDYIRASLLDTGGRSRAVSKEFRTRCYTAARATGGSIVGWDPPVFDCLKSFTATVFQFAQTSADPFVFLLTNAPASVLACASAPDLDVIRLPFTFMDFPELTAPFASSFRILTKQELEHPWIWTERDLASKDLTYWKPRTVGEVVFNFWD